MEIYERVIELCSQFNVEKTTLERACDFSQNSINKWQKSVPSIDKILKIADYFNVSVDYILGFTDEPKPIEHREVGKVVFPTASLLTVFEEIPDLLSEEHFINMAKIYHELPDELRERAYMLIYGMALGIGLNVENIIGR